jgi:Phage integrase family
MTVSAALDAAGRRRSPATTPGYHAGRAPRNKGQRYSADPPTVGEIIAVMRQAPDHRHGARCSSAEAREAVGARSAWTPGAGAAVALARRPGRAAGRAAVLHHRRPDPRPVLVERRGPVEFRRLAAQAGVRRHFAPHQLPHAHAVELAREGVPLNVIQRQFGHADLGTTSIYLQGIDTSPLFTPGARR